MSNAKKNIRKKSSTRAYRKIKIYYNLVFGAFILLAVIYGFLHTFTHKKDYRARGIEHFNNGEYEAAIEDFDNALNCNQWFSETVNVDIEMYKADSYIKLGDFSTANNVYSDILKKYPEKYYDKDEVDFLIELTNALNKYKNGDYVSTVACFNRAIEAGYVEMSLYAADCYEISKNYEEMKRNLDIYTAAFGYTPDICYKYASYYLAMEDYNNALSSIEQGIACGDSIYMQDFIYSQIVCYTKLNNYNTAYEYAKKYTAEYPGNTDIADMYEYLDTRVNIDTEVINDIYNQNNSMTDDTTNAESEEDNEADNGIQ